MPFITFKTTKTLTLQQEVSLKEITGQLISILPNKSEEYLMIHIEDNQVMYFRGKELECMKISVQLYKNADLSYKQTFTKKLIKEVEEITGIPASQIYLTIEEFENWGMDGELY
ncbi:MAG: hypothetical protein K2P09_08545 [Erysipelotrichales bacterium]|nr:hypothetical protein [Erysipelotrichales bacterium]